MTDFASICVNWTLYDVPAIWAMVGPEREWVSREQTAAWLRTSEMLEVHSSNLQALRERVAEHWSPEGSQASQTLLVELDSLIDSTTRASAVSRTNATALGLLVDALMEAKAGIEPLHEAWSSAVTNVQRDKLNQQARAVMSQADSRVIEHASLLAIPPEYVPPTIDGPGPIVTPKTSGSTGAAIRPAEVPPLREPPPLPAWAAFDPGDGVPPSAGAARPGSPLGPADPSMWPASPPVLAGGSPPSTPTSGLRDLPAASSPSQFVDSLGGRVLPVGGVLGLPSATPSAIGPRSPLATAFGGEPEHIGAPPPVEGVIGGKPKALGSRTGQATVGAGEPMEGGALLGGGLGAGGSRPLETRRRQYPADEEWETPVGVQSVIKPPPPPDPQTAFDPGPNVIGLNR
jgi:hypothetical protein